MHFDLAQTDALLATTRAVRRRLDLSRPVPRAVILDCLRLAVQAPTASNSQTWRWVVVDDPAKKQAIAALYRAHALAYLEQGGKAAMAAGSPQDVRVFESALWLAENLARVPAFLIPCVAGRPAPGMPDVMVASIYGSIYPAIWSFQLALRARGLGSALTTLHLLSEREVAGILGIPDDVMQVALLPVAYTIGTDFKPARRPPVEEITHWNDW